MNLEKTLNEAARLTVLSLKEEDFAGSIDAGGFTWDVYTHPLYGLKHSAVTIALRVELGDDGKKHVMIGLFAPGRWSIEKVRADLEDVA